MTTKDSNQKDSPNSHNTRIPIRSTTALTFQTSKWLFSYIIRLQYNGRVTNESKKHYLAMLFSNIFVFEVFETWLN